MNCLKIEWSRNVLFAAPRDYAKKRDATFTASREYVTVQVLKGLKCAVVCYFQGRIFNPTNFKSCGSLYLTGDANVSNLILIISNNYSVM